MPYHESMKARCDGFTMVEMMAVVAVAAILAMLAVPSYLDRIVREQIKGSLAAGRYRQAAHRCRVGCACRRSRPTMPPPGCRSPDKIVANYVSALAVQDGSHPPDLRQPGESARLRERSLSLRPAVVEDAPDRSRWRGSAAAPKLPEKMKVFGENLTSVPDAVSSRWSVAPSSARRPAGTASASVCRAATRR